MQNNIVTIDLPYVADSTLVFDTLCNEHWPIWLDSGVGFSDTRHSGGHHIDIMAANPIKKVYFDPERLVVNKPVQAGKEDTTVYVDIDACFATLESTLDQYRHQQPHGPGWFGYLSYDLFDRFEHIKKKTKHERIPQISLGFYTATIVTDHRKKTTQIYALTASLDSANRMANAVQRVFKETNDANDNSHSAPHEKFKLTSPFKAVISKQAYSEQFVAVKEFILQGDCYQINLTQEFSAHCKGSGLIAYNALRKSHSSPMSAYFSTPDFEILSMSPERFVAKRGQQLTTNPIKGTRPRGSDHQSDQALKTELSESQKDRAENVMIVDLLRNDLGRICEKGSINATKLFQIESYPNVHHLVSTVTGRLADHTSLFDIIKAVFPGGSITGAPKVRAMEIIEDLETHRRSIYCGSMVHFCANGDFDSNIAIRSLLIKEDQILCWGGGGVVADSDCDKEYQETWDKVGKLMKILEERFG